MTESSTRLQKIDSSLNHHHLLYQSLPGGSHQYCLASISEEFSMGAVGMSWVAMSFLLSSAVFLVPLGNWPISGEENGCSLWAILF